jgi:hypothetical protein
LGAVEEVLSFWEVVEEEVVAVALSVEGAEGVVVELGEVKVEADGLLVEEGEGVLWLWVEVAAVVEEAVVWLEEEGAVEA